MCVRTCVGEHQGLFCIFPPHYFRPGLSLELEHPDSAKLTGQSALGSTGLCLLSVRITDCVPPNSVFYMGSRGPNSGLHVYGTSIGTNYFFLFEAESHVV